VTSTPELVQTAMRS